MKRKPVRVPIETKKEFIRKYKDFFDRYMNEKSNYARRRLNDLAVKELGYSEHTYWLDMQFGYLYNKMYPERFTK